MGLRNRKHTASSEPLPRPSRWLAVWVWTLLVVACTGGSAVEPVGEPEEMSVEEFEAAVSEAFAATVDAPSVVVREDYDRQGKLISRTWTDYRPEEGASVHFGPTDKESEPSIQAAVETEDFFAMVDDQFDEWTVSGREADTVTIPRRSGCL